jgi:hypothetical protein
VHQDSGQHRLQHRSLYFLHVEALQQNSPGTANVSFLTWFFAFWLKEMGKHMRVVSNSAVRARSTPEIKQMVKN